MHVSDISADTRVAASLPLGLSANLVQKRCHVFIARLIKDVWEPEHCSGRWLLRPLVVLDLFKHEVEHLDQLLKSVSFCDFHPEHTDWHIDQHDFPVHVQSMEEHLLNLVIAIR